MGGMRFGLGSETATMNDERDGWTIWQRAQRRRRVLSLLIKHFVRGAVHEMGICMMNIRWIWEISVKFTKLWVGKGTV